MTHRGLRPHRRPPDRRPGRPGRVDRLAVPPPFRLGGLLRRAARRRGERSLAHRAEGRGRLHPARLPAGHPGPGHRVGDRRGRGPHHRLHAHRDHAPDLVRIVEGLRPGTVRGPAAALRLRLDHAVDAQDRRHRVAVAGPDTVWLLSEPEVRTGARTSVPTPSSPWPGPAGRLRPDLASLPRAAPRARRPVRGAGRRASDWQAWASRCRYDGPTGRPCVRSLITLKALTYAPTGGIVAAPTTSLPEDSAACATGTTATAGCGTPPSPSTPSSPRATRGGHRLAGLAAAGGGRRPGRPADHVRPRGSGA